MARILVGQIEAIVLLPLQHTVKVARGLQSKVIKDGLQHYKCVVGMTVVLAFKNLLHDIIAKPARHKLC